MNKPTGGAAKRRRGFPRRLGASPATIAYSFRPLDDVRPRSQIARVELFWARDGYDRLDPQRYCMDPGEIEF